MASLNVIKKIYTHEGGRAAIISPEAQLKRSVMACMLWEDSFYENGASIVDRISQLCKQVAPEKVATIALEAKHKMRLRHAPLFLARELLRTKEGRREAGIILPDLFTRPDDMIEMLAIYWKDGGKPLAKQLRKSFIKAFPKFDEYQLAKYKKDNKPIKLRDIIKLARPKPESDEQAALWKKLVDNTLAMPDTWEVELSKSSDKQASWNRLIDESRLGGLATLRNIRNMNQAGVPDEKINQSIAKINPGRLVPINFIAAGFMNPKFEEVVQTKFFEAFANKPRLKGKTVLLCDISGSMRDKVSGRSKMSRADVSAALSMIVKEIADEAIIYTFNQELRLVPSSRRGFALAELTRHFNGGTYLGQAVQAAVNLNPVYDRLIVITDEQSHDSVPGIANGYMINVASCKNGVGYGQWTHIDGWSDAVIDYIIKSEELE